MRHTGCEMPHRCVRRKCTSRRFSASSLTDSLRSVVRLRRAVSTHSKTKCCYPQNQGITPEKTCEQKTRNRKKAAPLAFFHRLRPLTSITKIDAQVRGGETRQDLKIPGVSPGSSLVRSPVPTLPFTGYLSAFLPSGSVALSHSSRCRYLSSV